MNLMTKLISKIILSLSLLIPVSANATALKDDNICTRNLKKIPSQEMKKIDEEMMKSARLYSALTLKTLGDLAEKQKLTKDQVQRALIHLFVHQIELVEKSGIENTCKITKQQCETRREKISMGIAGVIDQLDDSYHKIVSYDDKKAMRDTLAKTLEPLSNIVFGVMKWALKHPTSINGCK